jgi:hypothetical protein
VAAGKAEELGTVVSQHSNTLLEYFYTNITVSSRLRRVLADYLAVGYHRLNSENLPLDMIHNVCKSVQLLPADSGVIS